MVEKQTFTLSQVARSIRKTIENRYANKYWVKAEMHKLNLFASGHAFPELLDKQDGKIIAQMTGVIWKGSLQKINNQFLKLLNEPIREGGTFLMEVQVQYSETHGISLNILDIDPNYTLGELQRERRDTLLLLEKEHLLGKNQSILTPVLPKRVALISAETSKGLSDFMKVIHQNKEGYIIDTFLFNAYLQGEQAVRSIITQIQRINAVSQHFDLIAIVRGGGGEVGMSCYNNYELCRTIATSKLPIYTGIGHSTNFTVAEMVAHKNAITPTELAEGLIAALRQNDWNLQLYQKSVLEKSVDQLAHHKHLLSNNKLQLISNSHLIIERNKRFHDKSTHTLYRNSINLLQQNQHSINGLKGKIASSAKHTLEKESVKLTRTIGQFSNSGKQELKMENIKLMRLEDQIHLLDPKKILARGFSIVRFKGKTISTENTPQKEDVLHIETANFEVETNVLKITHHE